MANKYNQSEIGWFIDKIDSNKSIADAVDRMERMNELVIVQGIGTKNGNKTYSSWRRSQIELIEKIKSRNDTVFMKLKKNRASNTVFAKLKYVNKGK